MISNFLFSNANLAYIKTAMDASMMRQDAISNNIANVNTPGYKKQEVTFEDELARALESKGFRGRMTNEKHVMIGSGFAGTVSPQVLTIDNTSMRNDKNNVDIDEEMSNLSKNTIMYRTYSTALENELAKISQAISKASKV